MTRRTWRLSPLGTLIALGIANHVVLTGSRVAVSLDALALGGSAATVGALMALYAVLPMLLAIPAGRRADRIGARLPMLVGSCGLVISALLPVILPGLPTLFVTAPLMGVSFMAYQVAAQYTMGEIGGTTARSRNFAYFSLGYSTSSIAGPLIAGLMIDHAGYRAAFALLALAPLVPIAILGSDRLKLPGPHPAHASHATRSALDLFAHRELRRLFVINLLLAVAWELHTLFVPVYGNSIGLSASEIGVILASFATATFVVRLAMPMLARRFDESKVMTAALFIAGVIFFAFPFSRNVGTLLMLSFCLGIGVGATQPLVLAALHTHAPPGRAGEATGIRMSLVNSMAVAVPLVFGAIGGTVGMGPVLWSVGVFLATGGYFTRRA
jgi:MFS family permease